MTIAHAVAGGDYAGETAESVVVTVEENDTPVLSVASDGDVQEDAGSATFTVKLSLASSDTVTVDWKTADGTATAGSDYTAVTNGSLTFSPDGALEQTVSVTVTDDAVDEADETFDVTLSDAQQAGLASAGTTATATILDNDAAELSVLSDGNVSEDAGSATFTVKLSLASSRAVTVAWATADGTATGGSDYTAVTNGSLTFSPDGALEQTVSVTVTDDAVDEADETFDVTLSNAQQAGLASAGTTATATILDNDAAELSVLSDGNAGEDAGSATFTVKLSLASSRTVTVAWATADGTATAGSDYTAVTNGSLTFSPDGALEQTVSVTVTDDVVDEADETFDVTLSGAQQAGLASAGTTATATILDNDERGVTVAPTALTVVEGGTKPYTVVLKSEPTAAVTVEVTVPSGTDVTASPTELTFTAANWETAQTVTVTAAEDNDAVADEPVTITHAVAGGDYAGEAAEDVVVTVVENDAPTLSVESDGSVQEDAGSATFTVKLSLASSQTVTVDWTTADGTATAGVDYTAVTDGSLTFAPGGVLEQTVSVTVTDDAVDELDEMFKVTLSNAQYAALAGGETTATAEATILDNDERGVTVAPTALTVTEGGSAPYTVVLESEPTAAVTVGVMVPAGRDVTADTTVLTFTATDWMTAQTVRVMAAADEDAVADAPVTITHAVAGGDYEGETAESVEVTVVENDTPTLFIVSDGDVSEDAGSATFTVRLSVASSQAVTVEWMTGDGTATAGEDYVAGSGSLTFRPGGALTQTISVTVTDDTVDEPDETFTVTLSNARRATLAGGETTASAEATILDDDAATILDNDPPTLLVVSDGDVREDAGSATFTVRLSAASSQAVTVAWATADGTATAGADYAAGSGSVTFSPDGALSRTVSVTVTDDAVDELDETFEVTLSNARQATLASAGTTAEAKILDDDERGVTVAPTELTVTEGGSAPYTVVLESEPTAAVTIGVTVPTGTDVTADATVLTFTPAEWTTAQTVTVTAGTGGTAVTIAHPVSGGDYEVNNVTASDVVVTVPVPERSPPMLSISSNGGVPEDGGSALFMVKMSAESREMVTVEFSTADVTATGGADYTAASGRLTFSPGGALSQTIGVSVMDDLVDEPDETFDVTLSGAQHAMLDGGASTATAMILDDDVSTLDIVSDRDVPEDADNATFTVRLSVASSAPVTVDWTTADGTAKAGQDYTAATGSLTFSLGGALSQTIGVSVTDDLVDEMDETFDVTLSGAQHAMLDGGASTATAMILDNDLPTLGIVSDRDVPEDAGSATFTVTLSAASSRTVTAGWSTADGTATAGADYTAATGSLTFSPGGALSRTIRVSVTDDLVDETEETFKVTLSNARHAALAGGGTTASATAKILDDDAATLSVSSDGDVSEDAGSATFTVRLSVASSAPVTVDWTTADGTAKAGQDYTAATGRLTFGPGGALSRTIRVSVTDDLVDELDETFDVTLSGAQHARLAGGGGTATATVTIRDSDPIPKAWLARFGRTVTGHVMDAIRDRLWGPSNDGLQVVLGGYRLSRASEGAGAPEAAAYSVSGEYGASAWGGRHGADGASAWDGRRGEYGGSAWDGRPGADGFRAVTGRELLLGSSFLLAGGSDAGRVEWATWNRTAASQFDGAGEGVALDGDVTTFMLGADVRWGRWLSGTVVAHSTGDGGYRGQGGRAGAEDRGGGTLAMTLTTIHPYVRVQAGEGLSLWGVLGYGAGELTLTPDTAGSPERIKTGARMGMAAAGARGEIVSARDTGGFELAALIDVQRVQTSSAEPTGAGINLAAAQAVTSRLRLVLQGAYHVDLGGGRTLTPTLEMGARYDGGDAETGAGMEVGGGLGFTDANLGLTVQANARGLLAHKDADYAEWGAAGSVRFAPGGGLGLGPLLIVSSSRGAVSGGAARLWEARDARGLAPDLGFAPAGRLEAEAGWGLAVFDGRGLMTPVVGLAISATGQRTWRTAVRWTLGPGLAFGVEGTMHEAAAGGAAEPGIAFHATARW